jgi:hypothetical protein
MQEARLIIVTATRQALEKARLCEGARIEAWEKEKINTCLLEQQLATT